MCIVSIAVSCIHFVCFVVLNPVLNKFLIVEWYLYQRFIWEIKPGLNYGYMFTSKGVSNFIFETFWTVIFLYFDITIYDIVQIHIFCYYWYHAIIIKRIFYVVELFFTVFLLFMCWFVKLYLNNDVLFLYLYWHQLNIGLEWITKKYIYYVNIDISAKFCSNAVHVNLFAIQLHDDLHQQPFNFVETTVPCYIFCCYVIITAWKTSSILKPQILK